VPSRSLAEILAAGYIGLVQRPFGAISRNGGFRDFLGIMSPLVGVTISS
jgi:hypothetical protein